MKILYCTDFSDAARFSIEKAIPFLKPDGEIDIISVIETAYTKIETYKINKIENLQKAKDHLESKGLKVSKTLCSEGEPTEIVIKQSQKENYDLIIIGSRRELWLKWLGSTSRKIVSRSNIPVFIARKTADKNFLEKKDILFAVDGSENSYNSVKKAVKLINFENSTIEILFVKEGKAGLPVKILADKEWTERMLAHENENAVKIMEQTLSIFEKNKSDSVSQKILEGNPATKIMEYAEKQDKDLIIMGSHGREGVSSLLLGSISKIVLDNISRPVIIVPTKKPHM